MNFREQLSEAYKAGFNQGLQELYAGAHEGAHEEDEGYHEGAHEKDEGYHEGMKRGLMAGYHEAMKEMGHKKDEGAHEKDEGAHEKDEGYHEEMDEKALAELGRMMIRAGMHEMDHEEDEGYHEGMHEGEHEDEIEEVSVGSPGPVGFPAGFLPALFQGRLTKPLLGRSHRRKSTPGTKQYDPTYVLSKEFRRINRDMRDNPDDYTFPGGLGG